MDIKFGGVTYKTINWKEEPFIRPAGVHPDVPIPQVGRVLQPGHISFKSAAPLNVGDSFTDSEGEYTYKVTFSEMGDVECFRTGDLP